MASAATTTQQAILAAPEAAEHGNIPFCTCKRCKKKHKGVSGGKPPRCAGIIAIAFDEQDDERSHRVVMCRNKSGKQSYPKGGRDPGDSVRGGAVREWEEETGLNPAGLAFSGSWIDEPHIGCRYLVARWTLSLDPPANALPVPTDTETADDDDAASAAAAFNAAWASTLGSTALQGEGGEEGGCGTLGTLGTTDECGLALFYFATMSTCAPAASGGESSKVTKKKGKVTKSEMKSKQAGRGEDGGVPGGPGGGGDDGRGWCPPAEDEHDDDPIVEVRWETVVDVAKGRLSQLHPDRCAFSTAALELLREERKEL